MSCQIRSEEHTDLLLAYAAGKLRGDAAAMLELHMKTCEDCAAFGRAQANVWNMLDNWEVRPVSADFNRQLYARLEAASSASWWERLGSAVNDFVHPLFARPAFPLAAASLVIVAGFVLDHPGRSVVSLSESALSKPADLRASSVEINKVDKLEVDQVEATLDDIEMLRQFDAKQDDSGKETSSKSM
jgi:anti-sigma factor RsiW